MLQQITQLALDCTCESIEMNQWNNFMHSNNPKPFPYKNAKRLIKKLLPEVYKSLALQYHNPWENDTVITDKHIIITHSAIEYFFTYNH